MYKKSYRALKSPFVLVYVAKSIIFEAISVLRIITKIDNFLVPIAT